MEDLKLIKLPISENRIQNVIDRFHGDLMADDDAIIHAQNMLAVIHDYIAIYDCEENHQVAQVLVNIQNSIMWLDYWNVDDSYFE